MKHNLVKICAKTYDKRPWIPMIICNFEWFTFFSKYLNGMFTFNNTIVSQVIVICKIIKYQVVMYTKMYVK